MPLAIRQHVFQVDVQIVTAELRGAGSDRCLPRPAVPLAAEPANSQLRSGRGPLHARASCLLIDYRAHIRARVSARWSSCQKPTALIGTDTSPRCSRIPLVREPTTTRLSAVLKQSTTAPELERIAHQHESARCGCLAGGGRRRLVITLPGPDIWDFRVNVTSMQLALILGRRYTDCSITLSPTTMISPRFHRNCRRHAL